MYVMEITSFIKMPDEKMKAIHREFLKKMLGDKKLILAGRMLDNTGSFLLWEVNDTSEAKRVASSDPYFENGFTTFVLKGWDIFWNGFMNPPKMPL
jgi:uncharacterized protein YciI